MNEDEQELTLDDLEIPDEFTPEPEPPQPQYMTAEDLAANNQAMLQGIRELITEVVSKPAPAARADDDDDDIYVTKADLKRAKEEGKLETLTMLAPHLGPMLTRNRVDEVAARHGMRVEDVQARLKSLPESIQAEVLNHDGYWADQKAVMAKFSPSRGEGAGASSGNASVEKIIKTLKLSPEKAVEFRKNAAKAVRDGYVA